MKTSLSIALGGCLALALAGAARAGEIVSLDPTAVHDESPVVVDSSTGSASYVPRFWAEADYLLIFTKSTPVPTLVTTGPADALGPSGFPGVAGLGATTVLGNQNVGFNPQSGFRAVLGAWLDCDCRCGVETAYLRTAERSSQRMVSSSGVPGSVPLSIPFFDASLGQENSIGIAGARDVNSLAGGAQVSVTTRVQSAELNGLRRIYEGPAARTDLLFGYRWVGLDENLFFDTSSTVLGAGNTFRTSDSFRSSNDFHGLQVGLREQVYFGRLFFRATGLIAAGNVHQLTRMDGSLVTNDFSGTGALQRFNGGYLVLPSNTGHFATDRFAFSPEATVGVGLHLRDWLRVSVSYTFLYLSTVERPGEQVDRVINPTQGPAFTGDPNSGLNGAARPAYQGRSTDYLMMGASIGAEIRF
jgi:hypothetical protein